MSNFDYAIKKLLIAEGGYTNNPNDYGNYNALGQLIGTNYGVTSNVYKSFYGYYPTVEDMRNMTTYEASLIYKNNYWNAYGLDAINSKEVASAILDTVVLFSPKTIIKLLPFNLNLWSYKNLRIDYINSIEPSLFLKELITSRINFHTSQVQRDATQGVFLKGWINRANSLNTFINSLNSTSKNSIAIGLAIAGSLIFLYYDNEKKKKK